MRATHPLPEITTNAVREAIRDQLAQLLGSPLPVTISVPAAARIVGVSRRAGYRAAERGELPTRRFGKKVVVPVAVLIEMLSSPSRPDGAATGTPPSDDAATRNSDAPERER